MNKEITVSDLRKDLKSMGYKLQIKTLSSFKAATVTKDGVKINTQIMTKEHLETHSNVINYIKGVRGNIFDGSYRVVL